MEGVSSISAIVTVLTKPREEMERLVRELTNIKCNNKPIKTDQSRSVICK